MGRKKSRVIINKESDEKYKQKIFVSLPVPDGKIIANLAADDGAIHRYLETCEKIAKLESETILKCTKARFAYIWKLLLIISVFIVFILCLIISDQIKLKWGNHSYESTKSSKK